MKTQEELFQETIALLEKKLATLKEMRAEIDESIARTEEMMKLIPDIYDQL
jgi:hypothetical protein